MKWLSEIGSQLGKRLNVRDTLTLFQALTPWPATSSIGTNYMANTFYGIVMVQDNVSGDEIMICSSFLNGQTYHFSKKWTIQKDAEFFLYAYDFLLGKGWGGVS